MDITCDSNTLEAIKIICTSFNLIIIIVAIAVFSKFILNYLDPGKP